MNASLEGVLIIEPDVFEDNRGYFMETYHQSRYKEAGIPSTFVQENLNYSYKGVLRGLHYQIPHTQAKLIQVVSGEVFDVAVDIRVGSPSFSRWAAVLLSGENKRQFYVPEGFAHGLYVLSERAVVLYSCSDFYAPDCERGILWDDPLVGISWPTKNPLLSRKDSQYPYLKEVPAKELPRYRQ